MVSLYHSCGHLRRPCSGLDSSDRYAARLAREARTGVHNETSRMGIHNETSRMGVRNERHPGWASEGHVSAWASVGRRFIIARDTVA
ncbi:MAG: hypothetical protein K2F88_07675 [Duncaniella sp.]|nr:hypothetical protein [Duncaniella sp.]